MKMFPSPRVEDVLAGIAAPGAFTGEASDSEATGAGAREVYDLLLEAPEGDAARRASRRFLQEQLEQARDYPHDFPEGPHALEAWMERNTRAAGEAYAEYLEGRRQGGPRRWFTGKAHALSFLQRVAPTKLVDGAWLYGILPYWKDPRFQGLLRTYLEELGEGVPEQNHVALYRRVLVENDCETLPPLSDAHYVRGAIQLAFAYNAEHFLPELVGYNLGYEQLPLHLLITAFELGELGIDPYYFTLHVTIDNASTGHARRAVDAVKSCLPVAGGAGVFWRRVLNGYQLNDAGLGADDIVKDFDLERELVAMLERKREFGRHVHSDYAAIGGRTVNEWLSVPGRMREFLGTLEEKRWIIRHQPPEQSRFWGLVEGPRAPMAGVFDGYEKRLIHDWIAGDSRGESSRPRRVFRRYAGSGPTDEARAADRPDDVSRDVADLRRELLVTRESRRMQCLIDFMSPSKHATAPGLYATREFVRLWQGGAHAG